MSLLQGFFYFLKLEYSLIDLLFVCMYVITQVPGHVWRSKDNFRESLFSSHYVSPTDETQVVRLGRKCLLPMLLAY